MQKRHILLPLVAVLPLMTIPAKSQAVESGSRFVCGRSQGVPSTIAIKSDGSKVPIIRWTSTTFASAGWSHERRCQVVSNRFNTFYQQGRLSYLTTGRMNGLPVICTAANKGGGCDGLLYTLKPGQNATATLQALLDIRVRARGALNETTSRLYISLDDLMNPSRSKKLTGEIIDKNPKTPQPAKALW